MAEPWTVDSGDKDKWADWRRVQEVEFFFNVVLLDMGNGGKEQ